MKPNLDENDLYTIKEWLEANPQKNIFDWVYEVRCTTDEQRYNVSKLLEGVPLNKLLEKISLIIPQQDEIRLEDVEKRIKDNVAKSKKQTRLKKLDRLRSKMESRGLNELLVVPLDCDGNLLWDIDYLDVCGEWTGSGSSWPDYDVDVITRFAIIDGNLYVKTVNYNINDGLSTDNRETEWISSDNYYPKKLLQSVITECLGDSFPWDFTETHPGSRYLPYNLDITEYVTKFRGKANLQYIFSGLNQITNLDLSILKDTEWEHFENIFMGCKNLESIDLSGVSINSEFTGSMFNRCDSLKQIIMSGCNETTINAIRKYVLEASLPNKVKIITDSGEEFV